jgi:FMN phosphatase YigB (HAD superfamily)
MDEPPERIAFVGDDGPNDYDGAAAAGMVAVLLGTDSAGTRRTIDGLNRLIDPATTAST